MHRENAVIYCEGSFDTTYGKTAHGLVRFTEKYNTRFVIDSHLAGADAGFILDGKESGILIVRDLTEALLKASEGGIPLTHFVIGIATDGGFLDSDVKKAVLEAAASGLNIDSGLHEFVSDLPELQDILKKGEITVRDIRKPKQDRMHAFTGEIEDVGSIRLAMLGTDSAIGKRTSAWILVDALRKAGITAQMIGTGQTAWMQGARYGIILDSLLNDYISGELEHALMDSLAGERNGCRCDRRPGKPDESGLSRRV